MCNLCAYVLFGPEGDAAACVEEGVVQINWPRIEDLASYVDDLSPRAANVAKLLLAVRSLYNQGDDRPVPGGA